MAGIGSQRRSSGVVSGRHDEIVHGNGVMRSEGQVPVRTDHCPDLQLRDATAMVKTSDPLASCLCARWRLDQSQYDAVY